VVEGERLNAGLHQYSNDSSCLRLHQSVEVYSYMLSVVHDALRSVVKHAGLTAAVLERREKRFCDSDHVWCGRVVVRCQAAFPLAQF
jgi:hypothetical protein